MAFVRPYMNIKQSETGEWGGLNSAVDTLRIGLMIRLASAYRSWLGADKEQPSIVLMMCRQSEIGCEGRPLSIIDDGRGEFPFMGSTLSRPCFYVNSRNSHSLSELSSSDDDDGLWLMQLRYFVSFIHPFSLVNQWRAKIGISCPLSGNSSQNSIHGMCNYKLEDQGISQIEDPED